MGRRLQFFPTCGSPSKTLSFRATTISGELQDMVVTGDMVESVIRGLSSDRFFFKPAGKTSSILEEAKPNEKQKQKQKEQEQERLKENVSMMEMESTDPFVDFKKSMQEMVEADESLREWENLQELLSLYLAVNDKINHGYIIGAFVDLLLVNLGSSSSPSSSSSYSIIGQEQSLLMESSGNNKKMMISGSSDESPESGLSFTSSSRASSSGSATCSSISHCLSSISSLEEEEEDCYEDHSSPQKAAVSSLDYASSSLNV